MSTRTICCKMLTTPVISEALDQTSKKFSDSCNFVLSIAAEKKTHNAIELHKLCYRKCREQFGLSANLAVRSIRRVLTCMTHLKGKRKQPKKFFPKSIDYDARIFAYREEEESVSLTTVKGRIVIPLILGDFQRKQLAGKFPSSATVMKKGSSWYVHISVQIENSTPSGKGVLGIDCGIGKLPYG